MKKLKLALASLTAGLVVVAPGSALAGPPEHCYSPEFGDPCKPVFIVCERIADTTKDRVTCGD